MNEIDVSLVRDVVAELCVKSNKKLPEDIECSLNCALKKETGDLAVSVLKELEKNKFKIIEPPREAVAFNGRKVVFLINREIGLIELVEE